jgi:hypothetical protein
VGCGEDKSSARTKKRAVDFLKAFVRNIFARWKKCSYIRFTLCHHHSAKKHAPRIALPAHTRGDAIVLSCSFVIILSVSLCIITRFAIQGLPPAFTRKMLLMKWQISRAKIQCSPEDRRNAAYTAVGRRQNALLANVSPVPRKKRSRAKAPQGSASYGLVHMQFMQLRSNALGAALWENRSRQLN